MMSRRLTIPLGAFSVFLLSCSGGKQRSGTESVAEFPTQTSISQVPLGDMAGVSEDVLRAALLNPYSGDDAAIQEGETYFHWMNCVSCHGYGAHGGMGPDLTDAAWRYGGTPVEIYKSIFEGRPKGMPAWGATLPASVIWKVTAYVESLGGAVPPRAILADLEGWAAQSPKGKHVE